MNGPAERIYLSVRVPYGEHAAHVQGHPRGEVLAPGALHHAATDRNLRLYLQHDGDRGIYRIPAGRLWEGTDGPEGLTLTFELHRTEEGRRAQENALDSTTGVSPELYVMHDHPGPRGERVIDAAALHAIALVPFAAYPGAAVTAIQTATERRAARLAAVAGLLDRIEQARAARAAEVARLLAVHWDAGLAERHVSAEKLALIGHRW